jgi:hypothetical protein
MARRNVRKMVRAAIPLKILFLCHFCSIAGLFGVLDLDPVLTPARTHRQFQRQNCHHGLSACALALAASLSLADTRKRGDPEGTQAPET